MYRYREYKPVRWSQLQIGDEVNKVKHSTGYIGHQWTVEYANPLQVSLVDRNQEHELFDAQTCIFDRRLTDQEIKQQYAKSAKDVYTALKNVIPEYEAGEHTYDNSWLGDCFEMAMNQQKMKFKVVGVINLDAPKHGFFDKYDKGIVIEYDNGEKVWCHSNTRFINTICELYEYDV